MEFSKDRGYQGGLYDGVYEEVDCANPAYPGTVLFRLRPGEPGATGYGAGRDANGGAESAVRLLGNEAEARSEIITS